MTEPPEALGFLGGGAAIWCRFHEQRPKRFMQKETSKGEVI